MRKVMTSFDGCYLMSIPPTDEHKSGDYVMLYRA